MPEFTHLQGIAMAFGVAAIFGLVWAIRSGKVSVPQSSGSHRKLLLLIPAVVMAILLGLYWDELHEWYKAGFIFGFLLLAIIIAMALLASKKRAAMWLTISGVVALFSVGYWGWAEKPAPTAAFESPAVADTSDATQMRAMDLAASAAETAVASVSSFSPEQCDEWVVQAVKGGTVVVMDQHTPVLFNGPLTLSPVSNKVEDLKLYHKMVGSPPLCGEGARYEPNVAEWERRGISSAKFIVRDGMSDDEVTAMQVALREPTSSSPITF